MSPLRRLPYRLDCSRATVDAYVKSGLLPKPEIIGNLSRWDFGEVRAFIKSGNIGYNNGTADAVDNEDAYLKGIRDGRKRQARVTLPAHVHAVTARGKDYFYYQPFRGTMREGERRALPGAPVNADGTPMARGVSGIKNSPMTLHPRLAPVLLQH